MERTGLRFTMKKLNLRILIDFLFYTFKITSKYKLFSLYLYIFHALIITQSYFHFSIFNTDGIADHPLFSMSLALVKFCSFIYSLNNSFDTLLIKNPLLVIIYYLNSCQEGVCFIQFTQFFLQSVSGIGLA
jgi:hypothetical protein